MVGKAIPILRVGDLDRSLAYYVEKLGFSINWRHKTMFASVSRDTCTLFLCVGDQGHAGTWVWIGVPDVHELHREYRAKGAFIRDPPTNHPWAYEMQVSDPDEHVLRFGSDPDRDQPFGGFLDMNGARWPGSEST